MYYTDDPVRDAMNYELEQESWLAKRPVCEICGEPIQDDYLYDIDGVIHCEECMKDEYRKCAEDYEKE